MSVGTIAFFPSKTAIQMRHRVLGPNLRTDELGNACGPMSAGSAKKKSTRKGAAKTENSFALFVFT